MPSLKSFFKNITFHLHPHAVFATLPEFPQFKALELSDKHDIERITSKYPPYSDFNFVSMWSWDIKGQMRVSQLHGNLVVRFTDYQTGKPFYSFLGDNHADDTAEKLLNLAKEEGIEFRLRLVPEAVAKVLDRNMFEVIEDRDHFDYILDAEKLNKHTSKKLRYHYNLSSRLSDECGAGLEIRPMDLDQENQKKEVVQLTDTWVKNKSSQDQDTVSLAELDAIKRLFLARAENNLSLGIFYNNKLVGCSINEFLMNDSVLCHFMKADSVFKGIYSFLFIETSRLALNMGKKYINIEQDLGLPNLRQSKESFEPVDFLKKYIITLV